MDMATSPSTNMSTSTSSMDSHSTHMDMSSCKISMLWNWNTIDACFLSSSWHITSHGMFAGSCIGVICLVICLEGLRRIGREYDSFIVRRARLRSQYSQLSVSLNKGKAKPASSSSANIINNNHSNSNSNTSTAITTTTAATPCNTDIAPVRPTAVEQTVRALLHMLQFAVAYFVMLLAMYFNGYIIICIFIGAFLGAMIFSWEPLQIGKEIDATAVTKCCG